MDTTRLSNLEIVTIAVFLLGGELARIDIEDIAMKSNEIAPGRFSWRKYPDQINIRAVQKRLFDAASPKYGALLIGTERAGWQLTERGATLVRERLPLLQGGALSREPTNRLAEQQRRSEKTRMLASSAFSNWQAAGIEAVSQQDAETLFRIDDYVAGKARERKIERALNLFGSDPDLGDLVRALAARVRRGGR
jgi:hypothetical protein